MSRTQGTYSQDTPQKDGQLIVLPGAGIIGVTGTSVLTRLAAGEFSLRTNQATQAYVLFGAFSTLLRTGVQDDLQEGFGSSVGASNNLPVGTPQTIATATTAAGSAVTISVKSTVGFTAGQWVTVDTVASTVQEIAQITSITNATSMVVAGLVNAHTTPFPVTQNIFTTPAGAGGRPPFAGQAQLTPVTAARPKGVMPKYLTVIYAVNTTDVTVPTVGLFATQYINNVAPAVTTLITNATNGLATAAQTNPYVITVPVPIANRTFVMAPNSVITAELDFTSGGSGSVDVLAMILTCDFNYL